MEVKATIEPFNLEDADARYAYTKNNGWAVYQGLEDLTTGLVLEHIATGLRFQVKVVVNMDED